MFQVLTQEEVSSHHAINKQEDSLHEIKQINITNVYIFGNGATLQWALTLLTSGSSSSSFFSLR